MPLNETWGGQLTPLFRPRYVGHGICAGRVEVDVQPLAAAGAGRALNTVCIRARRLLKATGFDVEMLRTRMRKKPTGEEKNEGSASPVLPKTSRKA